MLSRIPHNVHTAVFFATYYNYDAGDLPAASVKTDTDKASSKSWKWNLIHIFV